MKKKILYIVSAGIIGSYSCTDFLDVVPDGVSHLENAFTMRYEAEKYLFTCYSYMNTDGDIRSDPALWGDEMWTLEETVSPQFNSSGFSISRGLQNASNPLINMWGVYYRAIRDCNIFLENVGTVPDLPSWEREKWISEVKVLKAYYHFLLVRMYGPVPIVRENLPIDASGDEVRVFRNTADECFQYICELLDEAKPALPVSISNPAEEMGRITRPIAYALKAKVLVTAASPLFNGNTDYASLQNPDGTLLFNQQYSVEKWVEAAAACEDAVRMCVDTVGMKLYQYPGHTQYDLSEETILELSLRNAVNERWNNEIIWANTQTVGYVNELQRFSIPKLDSQYIDGLSFLTPTGVPLKIAEQFYSSNGVPITEDKTWTGLDKYELIEAGTEDELKIRRGATTVRLNFNREPRFYAFLGFDTGIWYGQGHYDDTDPNSLFSIWGLKGQLHGRMTNDEGPVTGYYFKKYVHFQNVISGNDAMSYNQYPWVLIRLSDLFLLYAEARNEAEDSETARAEARQYLDRVRERAGLPTVADAWDNYSVNPNAYKTQSGLRNIIRQERLNELCFEGQRFWDIRRWKTAIGLYRTPIQGWDIQQNQSQYYYRPVVIRTQTFGLKDYLWPISNADLLINKNLVQNVGW